MSLYGALFSGVSGLAAQSSAMGAISDNITNVNTIGYKGTKVNFQTLVTKQTSLTNYAPGGVQSKPRTGVDVQGLLQATNSSTDVALSGQGFFVVNEAADPQEGDMFAYTRAGSFKVDSEGYLQNVSGWYMQGWPLMSWDNSAQASTVQVGNNVFMKAYKDDSGNTNYINDNIVSAQHLRPINLNEVGGTASQTRNLRMGANLPNGADIGKIYKQPVTIYDSLGGDATVQFSWSKIAQNRWDLEAIPPQGAKSMQLKDDDGNIYSSVGRLDFLGKPVASTGDSFTMTLNGTTHTFTMDGGTENATTHYIDPDAASSTGEFVSSLATSVQKAYNIAYDSESYTWSSTGTNDKLVINGTEITSMGGLASSAAIAARINTFTATTGVSAVANAAGTQVTLYTANYGTIKVGGSGAIATALGITTTSVTPAAYTDADNEVTVNGTAIDLDAATDIDSAIALVNAQAATTGVWAAKDTAGTAMVFFTDQTGPLTVVGTAASDFAALNGTVTGQSFTGTGTTYAERLAGTDSLIFRQFDATNSIAVAGLDTIDLSNGNPATLQGMDTSSSDGFTLADLGLAITNDAVEFNGDGTPKTINVASMAIDWANGSEDMTGSDEIGMFLGNLNVRDGMTQLDGDYQLAYWSQNGAKFGNFAGVSIGSDGIVTALFDNGVTRAVFQIPVATFVNPNGMDTLSGNVFISTDNSGEPTLRTAGSAGAGQVSAASLEASTVDIGEEFTTMIVTQRAYSAAAKIITTSDEMLDELVRIKR